MSPATDTQSMPILGAEGDACSVCQAPLAIDQRYCLQCGQRRGASRVDFAELLPADPASAAPQGGMQVQQIAPQQGAWTPLALVGSIATLALMLLVGVMIGKDDNPEQIAATAPVAPVAATGAAGETATGAQTASAGGGAGGAGETADGGAGGSAKGGGGGGGGSVAENPPPAESAEGAEVVDDAALDALGATAPEDYAEASKNLPDTIALPGEPPPVDNEEPGGGSEAEVIK